MVELFLIGARLRELSLALQRYVLLVRAGILADDAGLDLDHVYDTDELVGGNDVFFAATGASTGELLKGVDFVSHGATTQSLVMRSRSGTIRWVEASHDFSRLDKIRFGA